MSAPDPAAVTERPGPALTLGRQAAGRAHVVIIGGVAAGMSAATRLRRLDEQCRITVLERGEHVSFANCGLPYYVGEVITDRGALLVQTPASLAARFDIEVHTRSEAVAFDPLARTVTVRDRQAGTEAIVRYDALVLTPGAEPILPDVPGVERALTLRDVSDADRLRAALDGAAPTCGGVRTAAGARTALVVGAGFIGLEVAENLHTRGLSVTVLDLADHVLPPLDPEMAAEVTARLKSSGIAVRTGTSVTSLGERTATLTDGTEVSADVVVMAIGVQPATALARAAGLARAARSGRGAILTDAHHRTSAPGVWAAGDAVAKRSAISGVEDVVSLAQPANLHGRQVADDVARFLAAQAAGASAADFWRGDGAAPAGEVGASARQVDHAIGHTTPGATVAGGRPRERAVAAVQGTAIVGVLGLQAAMTGWSEGRARAAGMDVLAVHTHPVDHAGYYPGARQMHLKLVVERGTGRILGAQGVGESGVDKAIDVVATAMRGQLTAWDLPDLETTYAPPFGSAKAPVQVLGMVAANALDGVTDTVQWHELEAARQAGATVVDVRTPAEYARGHIPGALSIPVDSLRERVDEIPAGEVIVSCQVGLRGHVAARVLAGRGRRVRNLDGGFLTWVASGGAVETGPSETA